jgi:hypothetical protein
MWSKAQDLRLSAVMGLRKGLRLILGMRRSLTEEAQHKIADAIVGHLEQSNSRLPLISARPLTLEMLCTSGKAAQYS